MKLKLYIMKQKKNLISALLLLLFSSWAGAQNIPVKLNVDAGRQIATVTKLFNGSNIEDLNNQTMVEYLANCFMERLLKKILTLIS